MIPSIRFIVRRLLATCALALTGLLAFAPQDAHALQSTALTAANLQGKTLRFTTTGGNAPFETSGGFTIVFGPNNTYAMPIADGNAAARSGTYTLRVDNTATTLTLAGYILNNATVQVSIIHTNDALRSQFEMFTNGANKRGTVDFDTGVSGSPSVTSATTVTATTNSPFTYNITTNPAATSYTNSGGNAPVAINPSTGIVTGTFTTVGTFTFSFTANNNSGSSPVTTVTVTVTAGTGGNVAQFAGRYVGKIGSRVSGNVNDTLSDYEVIVSATGTVTVNIGSVTGSLTGTINASGVITFTSGTGIDFFNLRTATITGTSLSSDYNPVLGNTGAQYRFVTSTSFTPASGGTAVGFLSNLSVRAPAGAGDATLIVGVTIGGGSGAKGALIRGVGPALTSFGVAGALSDPVLTVYQGSSLVTTNDDWGTEAGVAATASAVGAFPFTAGSRDAAINAPTVAPGSYTIQLTGKAGATGNALVELYDTTPAASVTSTSSRFTNLSARTFGGTDSQTLIVGFNLAGTQVRRLLFRAVGPGLAAFGVGGTMPNPKLELYRGQTKIGENDDWAASTLAAQQSVGAFALTAGSRDAVLVMEVQPGSHTVQVTGGTTGVALVEVYELP